MKVWMIVLLFGDIIAVRGPMPEPVEECTRLVQSADDYHYILYNG